MRCRWQPVGFDCAVVREKGQENKLFITFVTDQGVVTQEGFNPSLNDDVNVPLSAQAVSFNT
jgi:hypothetical protein